MNLVGKTALVTGASRGIGGGKCLGLAERGATVVASARSPDARQGLRSEIESLGSQALTVDCDVASEPSIVAMIEGAREQFSHIDIVVCSAGVLFESIVPEIFIHPRFQTVNK